VEFRHGDKIRDFSLIREQVFPGMDLNKPSNLAVMRRPYLIIGGTTKAATTSVYTYLGDHPEVCVSNLKETRFFLDLDYPLESKYRFEVAPDKYGDFFSPKSADVKLWVDATPDYLYSSGTPERINSALEDVRLVFLLREPISRVVSWYRFAIQNNSIGADVSFDEYACRQLDHPGPLASSVPQHMRAVEQGRYVQYLRGYFDIFGRERIFVSFLEDISRNPHLVMLRLSEFSGIDPSFYDGYEFKVFNKTENLKNPAVFGLIRKLRFNVNRRINRLGALRRFLRGIKRKVEPVLMNSIRSDDPQHLEMSGSTRKSLKEYYEPANRELAKLLGRDLPW
jgi:hypothetical protein